MYDKPHSSIKTDLALMAAGARGYKKCPPPYKTKKLDSFKHRHVAYQNDRIEMLITNLKTVLKNIAPSSNKISLST